MYSVVVTINLTKDDLGECLKLPALETSKRVAQPQLTQYTTIKATDNNCLKIRDIYLTMAPNRQKYYNIKKSWY